MAQDKKIEDYMHLYLGCECQLFWRCENGTLEYERNGILVTVQPENKDQYGLGFKCKTDHGNFIEYAYPYSDIKPILRPLSDMSDEEEKEVFIIEEGKGMVEFFYKGCAKEWFKPKYNRRLPETLQYLLSKHFDLFNLIPEGLAIDKTTLK